MKKLVIAAGTGFLGNVLINQFKNKFDEIVILTRGESKIIDTVKYVNWDAKTLSGWKKALEDTDILINLTGKSVDCRYTEANKKEILNSRIESTKILNQAVLQCQNPPIHWLNSSTSTIYRHSIDKEMDEYSGEIGNDFSMNVAKSWEKSFYETETPKTIKTALRISIVLGKNGGAFVPLKNLTKFGFGGKQGNGNQLVSWIHEKDFARAVEYIIDKKLTGNINIVSPKPIKNIEFMKTLRKSLNVVIGIPVYERLIKTGAKLIGTEAELVLKSRNVIPKRLIENNFSFEYSDLKKALDNLTQQP